MAADVLTVTGATRGQPNLLQSSVTLMGSANHVHLTAQGNAILNELTLGSDADGVGLSSDKIGGDTFIVGTVFVDGKIEWLNRYANVQPVKEGLSATIETNGQDMIFGGTNVGRVRRSLNFVSNGGDIIIGKDISVDYGRGKVLDDPSTGTLTLSTTGTIDAGSGNVIIGTNDYRVLKIDQIGDIKAADVIIKPTDNGKITQVSTSIGNIDASGNVDIEIGTVNTGNDANASIGNITAGGNISLKAGHINGTVGNVKAGGDALVNIGSLDNIGEVTGKNVNVNIGDKPEAPGEEAVPLANVTFNGVKTEFNAYKVGEGSFFRIRDIAYQLAETDKKFSVEWTGNIDGIVTVTKGRDYTPNGTEMKAAGTETAQAFEVKPSVYVDSEKISCRGYKIGDDIYFNIDDLAAALGFDVEYYDDVVAIERPAGNDTFGHMPAGTYTYVASDPSADAESGKGQVSFIYDEEGADLIWEAVNEGTIIEGSEDISGDVWEFFYGVFLSDLPVTDWLQGEPKDTEGYAGNVSGNLDITITEDGKISALAVTSAATRVTAVLTPDITAPVLTVTGITQSRPYFLQSCITMVGAANALNLTRQGDVILDNFTAGSDENGIGLYGSKIGGDTFISGTFFIDGAISWNSKMGVITALEGEPGGTIMTNGQEIVINGGSNTGRAGRILNIISNGGDIKIGTMVSTDQTRGGIIPNPTAPDILSVSTSGIIDAGSGDVIIGTDAREDKGVEIDRLGTVKGNNVIIKPVNYGEPGNIVAYIGNIEAEGNVEIEAGIINTGGVQTSSFSSSDGTIERVIEVDEALIDKSGIVIGDITSENGNITVKASKVYGKVGTFTAPNGTVTTEFEQITE